jgi:hypothetical protein
VRVDRRELAAIFAGGVIGALARLGLVEALPSTPGRWPWATIVANVVARRPDRRRAVTDALKLTTYLGERDRVGDRSWPMR